MFCLTCVITCRFDESSVHTILTAFQTHKFPPNSRFVDVTIEIVCVNLPLAQTTHRAIKMTKEIQMADNESTQAISFIDQLCRTFIAIPSNESVWFGLHCDKCACIDGDSTSIADRSCVMVKSTNTRIFNVH